MTIEFISEGKGTPVLFIPGSHSTPSAWKPIKSKFKAAISFYSISLCGCGKTDETRTFDDCGIEHQTKLISYAIEKIGSPVHLVGHSFGGFISLAFAQQEPNMLQSLTLFEANPLSLLAKYGPNGYFDEVVAVSRRFLKNINDRVENPAESIIDFYGGMGFFGSMPDNIKKACNAAAPANCLDWQGAPHFHLNEKSLRNFSNPTIIAYGDKTNKHMKSVTKHLSNTMPKAQTNKIPGAGHFLISTHPKECAFPIEQNIKQSN
ncbi:MAG: hypothetical protein CML56_01660 [Rhodobacteraceae bacterium]|nr:hypothetical protein [Paracoccaceae bacterium]